MLKNDFIVRINKTSLILKADKDTLHNIAIILDQCVDMVRTLARKAERAQATQERERKRRQLEVTEENKSRSVEIFRRYTIHLNNGSQGNQTVARQEVAREYRLSIVDVKFFISLGRKTIKEEEQKKQGVLF